MNNSNLQKQIQYSLQLLMIIMISLEVAIPPNPYAEKILFIGFFVIVLKHDLVEKISKLLDKFFDYIGKNSIL